MDHSAPMPAALPHGFRLAGFESRPTRGFDAASAVLGRTGTLELKLATTDKEIRKAQRLRYKVFYEEGGAIPDLAAMTSRRDVCPFDASCDHLLVVDTAFPDGPGATRRKVVGTYRLMRGDVAASRGGFYSATAFDVAPLLRRHRNTRFSSSLAAPACTPTIARNAPSSCSGRASASTRPATASTF